MKRNNYVKKMYRISSYFIKFELCDRIRIRIRIFGNLKKKV